VVNVASRCGFTKQYAGLQKLYERYRARGFAVLGFPCNDFMGQEPGTHEEIREFCSVNFGVTFPLFAKIQVKGAEKHPLFAWLTDGTRHPGLGGEVAWNFTKFMVGRVEAAGAFGSRTTPDDPALVAAVEQAMSAAPQDCYVPRRVQGCRHGASRGGLRRRCAPRGRHFKRHERTCGIERKSVAPPAKARIALPAPREMARSSVVLLRSR
jgi:glutathione peroxidase